MEENKKENEKLKEEILQNVSEVLTEEELKKLLEKKPEEITVYCGYETSGNVHLGHLVTIMKLKQFHDKGFKVKVLFADYHTYLNRKGDWNFIHEQTKKWEETFKKIGLEKAEFILGSSFQKKPEYFEDLLNLSLHINVNRGLKSMELIARDFEHAKISQIIYPLMQIADIKHLNVDIAIGGMEQRKVHALGKDYYNTISKKNFIAIHTPLISSLLGKGKMSSSIPDSNISINDTEEEIKRKIKKAHCPIEKENNPILDITRLIIFPYIKGKEEFTIERPEKYGGNKTYNEYNILEEEYLQKKIHPLDLKNSVAKYLIKILK